MGNVGSIDESKFKSNETAAGAFDGASSSDQSQAKMLTVSGTYVMEVATFCFRNTKKPDKPIIISPTLADSSKGGINLVASLKVIEGTHQVAEGDYITINIPVWPGAKASQKDIENMFKLSKPRMCALLGDDNFKISPKALVEKFSTEWKEENGKFVLVKDHELKQKVVCVFDDDEYNNKPTLSLVSLRKYKEGDKSISNSAAEETPKTGFGSAATPAMDFGAAGETAAKSGEAPEVVQTDDLPF